MSQGEDNESTNTSYDDAMEALSSLIFDRNRADKSIKGIRLDLLSNYLEMLDLKEAIRQLKIIHVAGTKGKGSTCTFTESILRNYGFRTGLFTSPHLIDVRERFRLDGLDISEEKFLAYFWWCWDRLKEETTDEVPMPTWFRFLTLLAFKIFAAEQVDVAILEVGLGGKYDDTNVVETPIVCGISSLGYDHMEILGNTLGQIAGEKAGIFKPGVPAFTVPQPDEAMLVLEEKASQLDIGLQVAHPLDQKLLKGLYLGLGGEHQYQNAGLAIALCSTWLKRTNHVEINYLDQDTLPEQFIKGLTTARLQGRGQIVPDNVIESESPGDLMFYLDGAHTPESMDVSANWFCDALKEDCENKSFPNNQEHQESGTLYKSVGMDHHATSGKKSEQILLFNCMSVRDPQLLLPHLMSTCASHGVCFRKALFVPNMSVPNKVESTAMPSNNTHVDLSWQLTLQQVWESLVCGEKGRDAKIEDIKSEESVMDSDATYNLENSNVFPSLPLAINWLRDNVRKNRTARFQVLVTGSLRLVGDMLKYMQK